MELPWGDWEQLCTHRWVRRSGGCCSRISNQKSDSRQMSQTHFRCNETKGKVVHEELKRICRTLRTNETILCSFIPRGGCCSASGHRRALYARAGFSVGLGKLRILRAMLRLCRPLRGSCSLLWKSGQSGKTPSWRQAFTGPCGQDQSSQTDAHSNSRESSALLQCSYWQITDGNFVFILLRLKFIHQLHHRAPEKHT